MFLPVNGVALQKDNDHRTDDSIFISVILLMAMVCMVASSRANQSSTLGQGDKHKVGQREDDDNDYDDDQDIDNTELDNIYLLPQDNLKDNKIEIIAGSKIGSKWYVNPKKSTK